MQFPEEPLGTKGRTSAWRQSLDWISSLQTRKVCKMPAILACAADVRSRSALFPRHNNVRILQKI